MATTYTPAEIIPTPGRAQLHGLLDAIALLTRAQDTTERTAEAWWAWHDADSSRAYADMDEAETACVAWVYGDSDHGPDDPTETIQHAIDHLTDQIDDARAALAEADEPRPWSLREEGCEFRVFVGTRDEAIAEAEGCTDGDYGAVTSTIWTDIHAVCKESDEHESVTVEIEPDEPRCENGHAHDWQSPHEVLGGLKENPGVQGHGGGVIITEVCAHCGTYRVTDTWAQRPDTGEQGLTSVAYREADDESTAWVESLRDDDDE